MPCVHLYQLVDDLYLYTYEDSRTVVCMSTKHAVPCMCIEDMVNACG